MSARVASIPLGVDLVIRVLPPAAYQTSDRLGAAIDELLPSIVSPRTHQLTPGELGVSS